MPDILISMCLVSTIMSYCKKILISQNIEERVIMFTQAEAGNERIQAVLLSHRPTLQGKLSKNYTNDHKIVLNYNYRRKTKLDC